MTALIAYNTIQNTPGLIDTFTTEDPGDTGLPIDNVLDYATHTVGQMINGVGAGSVRMTANLNAVTPVNYLAFAGHNIPDGSKVNIADMNGGSPIFLESVFTSGTGPQLLPLSTTYNLVGYRIAIEGPDAQVINIGSFFMGQLLTLPMGLQAPYTPPPLGRDAIHYPSTPNRGSNYLGGYVQRVGWDFQVQQNNLEPSWVNVNWLPMVRHMEQRPFFYLWDDQSPEDAMYGWAQGKIAPPSYTSALRMAFNIKCRGLHVG